MKETKKERFIRFTIIIFSLIFVAVGYRFQIEKMNSADDPPKIAVLHVSESNNEPPIIAMYRWLENNHLLTIYRIDRGNRFHFQEMHTTELPDAPDKILGDQKITGVWAEIDGEWIFYDENLQRVRREPIYRDVTSGETVPYTIDKKNGEVSIRGNEKSVSFRLENNEMIHGIYSLTNDEKLYLVLFDNDVKLIVLE